MTSLPDQIAALPTMTAGGQTYLAYQAVIETVAASLFPKQSQEEIDAAAYQRILETADAHCREAGYTEVVKLTPPTVPMAEMGLYWTAAPPSPYPTEPPDSLGSPIIHAGPGRAEMLEDGRLLDARLSQRGLDEVSRQHFKIPVTASDEVVDLMDRAAASGWPNDHRGLWHDILGMCIAGGKDHGRHERRFAVIIRGLGRRRYWHFRARLQADGAGSPYLHIGLADEDDEVRDPEENALFELGHVVMTPGAAALGVDFTPYLARHAAGDGGDLETFDKRQNRQAISNGARILSAYEVPTGDEETTRIWVITEADRSATTILLPREY